MSIRNATTVAPFSTYTHTWAGNADIQSNALSLDGAGDYVHIPRTTEFNMEAMDFCIEHIVNFSSFPQDYPMFTSQWAGAGNYGFQFYYDNALNLLKFTYSTNGTATTTFSGSWTPSTSTDYHVAFSRSGDDAKLWVDGSQVGSTGDFSGNKIHTSTARISFGAYEDPADTPAGNGYLAGSLKWSKWTRKIPVYTASFTAPSSFTNDSKTLYLNSWTGADSSTPTNNTES
jgi:hypothetical protein